jgi:site-specific DNA-methyltransferase (adenine-specific)
VLADQEYELVPIDRLTVWPKNPRKGDIALIRESIKENDFYSAVVAQKSTGRIIAGTHRYLAAVEEGLETIPVIYIDVDDDRAQRINLADNRTSDIGSYDDQLLVEILQSLDTPAVGTGYADQEVSRLLAASHEPVAMTDPDDVPDPPAEPTTRLGDIWELGPHRLVCGNAEEVLAVQPAGFAELAFTSPPYNIRNTTGGGFPKAGMWPMAELRHGYDMHADNMLHSEYVEWQRNCLTQMLRVVTDDGAIFYNHKWRVQNGLMQDRADIVAGFPVRQIIIWNRGGGINLNDGYFVGAYEVIYLVAKPDFVLAPQGSSATDVWTIGAEQRNAHPAPFPVALPLKAIGATNARTVLDPFSGSGTTIIACHQLGRVAFGIELSPLYCDMTCKRWERHTGITPVRNGDKVSFTNE